MSVQAKAWGTTERLVSAVLCELHRIHIEPGGYCSEHVHHGRANVFYVVRGELEVRTGIVADGQSRRLVAGQYMTVSPGIRHQFYSELGAEVLELYYPVLRGEDIERFSEGGRG